MSPFPLFSLLENPDVFVSINNCKDSLGRFQVMPDVQLKNEDQPVTLKFSYNGRYFSLPRKFVGFYRIFYESEMIYSKTEVFSTKMLFYGEKPGDNELDMNSTGVGYHRPGSKLEFNIQIKLPKLLTGVYFMVFKISDFSFEPYLDAYTILRVKNDSEKGFLRNRTKIFGPDLINDVVKIDWIDEIDHEWLNYRVQSVKRSSKVVKDFR